MSVVKRTKILIVRVTAIHLKTALYSILHFTGGILGFIAENFAETAKFLEQIHLQTLY